MGGQAPECRVGIERLSHSTPGRAGQVCETTRAVVVEVSRTTGIARTIDSTAPKFPTPAGRVHDEVLEEFDHRLGRRHVSA